MNCNGSQTVIIINYNGNIFDHESRFQSINILGALLRVITVSIFFVLDKPILI